MSNALNVVPSEEEVSSGVEDAKKIADGLTDVLADTYRLVFKTHAYHWNVTGSSFYSIHKLTDGQYADMFTAADVLAERIRSVGQLAPHDMGAMMKRSQINDLDELPDAAGMVEDLASDHEKLAKRHHELVETAGKENDPVTEDLATARSAFHEQAAWMLRAIAAT